MDNRLARFNDCRMRSRSTVNGHSSRRGGRTKRCGLENNQTASAQGAIWPAVKLLPLLLGGLLSGCVQNSFVVEKAAPAHDTKFLLAPEVLLEVDDSSVRWGAGKVGDSLKTGLLKNGAFGKVYYPVNPTHTVPLKLRVVTRGDIRQDPGIGKAIATGLLLFLPVGVLQYRDTFMISAEAYVFRQGRKFGPIMVESRVHADHTAFAGPDSYATRAKQLVLDDLAARLTAALAEHPNWFSY